MTNTDVVLTPDSDETPAEYDINSLITYTCQMEVSCIGFGFDVTLFFPSYTYYRIMHTICKDVLSGGRKKYQLECKQTQQHKQLNFNSVHVTVS